MERFSKESVGRFEFCKFERTCLELLAGKVLVLAHEECLGFFGCVSFLIFSAEDGDFPLHFSRFLFLLLLEQACVELLEFVECEFIKFLLCNPGIQLLLTVSLPPKLLGADLVRPLSFLLCTERHCLEFRSILFSFDVFPTATQGTDWVRLRLRPTLFGARKAQLARRFVFLLPDKLFLMVTLNFGSLETCRFVVGS